MKGQTGQLCWRKLRRKKYLWRRRERPLIDGWWNFGLGQILYIIAIMNKSKTQTLEVIEDNILVSIQSNKSNSWLKENQEHSFYVPKNYTISHLRAFLTSKIFSQRSSHEASYFLFAYGCILNNHEKIGSIYEKFKHQIKNADKGL